MGAWTVALLSAMLWSAAMPALAQAQARYQCEFRRECIGTERPCGEVAHTGLALERRADGWHLWGSDETDFWLAPVPGGDDELRSWISTTLDPDTQTAALLSVFGDGQAFLSLHGIFLTPEVTLQTGTCRREDAR